MEKETTCNVCTDFKSLRKKTIAQMKQESIQECPPDSTELGRSTWTFLHTMAAYYPENASTTDQQSMKQFIEGLSKFYPCEYCADHLKVTEMIIIGRFENPSTKTKVQ
jgi:FAD-linked sulfhydryl oxidase